jgi:hypothetical protein
VTAPQDFGSHHSEALDLTNCRPWMSPINQQLRPLVQLNPESGLGCVRLAPSSFFLNSRLSILTSIATFSGINPLSLYLPKRSGVHNIALPNPIRNHVRYARSVLHPQNCQYTASGLEAPNIPFSTKTITIHLFSISLYHVPLIYNGPGG